MVMIWPQCLCNHGLDYKDDIGQILNYDFRIITSNQPLKQHLDQDEILYLATKTQYKRTEILFVQSCAK